MYGIRFKGKHSFKDFGITMPPGKEIGLPNKRKIIINVPFSNHDYDFSDLYGSETYDSRSLTYPFNILDKTKDRMTLKKTQIVNWLMSGNGKQKLYDDAFPGYYFLAEVEGQSSFQENWQTGELTVNFTAYPFMISELTEGNDIWDEFNFLLDVSQQVNFDVEGELTITLINAGSNTVSPKITASSSFTIEKSGTTYNVGSGTTEDTRFTLDPGENELVITGTGDISFEFYKELI